MRPLLYLPLLLLMIASLPFCKKNTNPGSEGIKDDVVAFHQVVNNIAKHFLATRPSSEDDEPAHSQLMTEWIAAQPGVRSVEETDIYVFSITHENGLSGNMLFTPKEDNPKLRTRGGHSSKGQMRVFNTAGDEEKLIENKNVLIVVAYASEFYLPYGNFEGKHLSTVLDLFDHSSIDFKVTVKVNEGIESFAQLDDYGIILFSTHGTPHGILTGQHYLKENLIAFNDNVEVADETEDMAMKLREGEIKLSSIWEYTGNEIQLKDASFELTANFFKTLPVKLDNSVLIGNYCYSGIENGRMGLSLEDKGLKAFYGYAYNTGASGAITNDLAWRAEDTIISNLISEYDTTGIAHLAGNTTLLQDDLLWSDYRPGRKARLLEKAGITGPVQLKQYLDKGYHFPKCGDSLTDTRDGRKYSTVCIGEQVWMGNNLNWAGAGICYNNSTVSCSEFGRLYTIAEVTGGKNSSANPSGEQGICPKGWHVPSKAEWDELVTFVGGEEKANTVLRSARGWPTPNSNTNNYKMGLQPGGLAINGPDGILFQYQGDAGYYWTITSSSSDMYYGINTYPPQVTAFSYGPASSLEWRFSCRCVKDKE